MYWLLEKDQQKKVREDIDKLISDVSTVVGNPQLDQLFPYVGRKDRRKAISVINSLTQAGESILEPFAGSGTIAYAAAQSGRAFFANDWEPYANRMANVPWRFPEDKELLLESKNLNAKLSTYFSYLYKTVCVCGNSHVFDSLFFDRKPLKYLNITKHERLGVNGENITYRQKYKCPNCGKSEKHFDDKDQIHTDEINNIPLNDKYDHIFNTNLIENSRINLTGEFLIYGNLFPHRSKLALIALWDSIHSLKTKPEIIAFFETTFLSILPQAKYKDYRSKSQDLHVPDIMLREVNILNRFNEQLEKRIKGIESYSFNKNTNNNVISCLDYREFMKKLNENSIDLIFTDPPWTDGNAYFEKAQLYHPWLGYELIKDTPRLENEFVVTDAPTRRATHDTKRWWQDMYEFFEESYRALKPLHYLSLYFRPIPASKWLENLNRLKLTARMCGFEPLLSVDVDSSDPSMRIQQSASYVFAEDIVFVFLKLPSNLRRVYNDDIDMDQLVYQCSEATQEDSKGPYTYQLWKKYFSEYLTTRNQSSFLHPKHEDTIFRLFKRYNDEINPGHYLPKPLTPFSNQLFDMPAEERLFTYVPQVINDLTSSNSTFTYDRFLLKLAEFVENGTRMLIDQIQDVNIRRLIEPFAEPLNGGKLFKKRTLPKLPKGIGNVLLLSPSDFEIFIGKLYEAQGFTSVSIVGRAGDRGVDLIAKDPKGQMTVIQCKRYIEHNVGSTPVQRLHSFATTRNVTRKILITTSDFTPDGIHEAKITGTELINKNALEVLIATFLPKFSNV